MPADLRTRRFTIPLVVCPLVPLALTALVRAQECVHVTRWGAAGSGPGQFGSPRAIAMGNLGSVYVADRGNDRTQEPIPGGSFLNKRGYRGMGHEQFCQSVSLVWVVARDGTGREASALATLA